MKKHSKFELAAAFFASTNVSLYDSQGKLHKGYVTDLQHEDGSGSSFNVGMNEVQGSDIVSVTFHLRTID